jgi:hypothetical protein
MYDSLITLLEWIYLYKRLFKRAEVESELTYLRIKM